ncbi:MAG: heme exporter protein CcmD [Gammaproteobacteria bacterium]|nr:MAG: heme exporter protein CcmD [Gammaproteobacteria bacterium]
MGGYAFYVWTSYGLALLVMLIIFFRPMLTYRQVLRDLRNKFRQQDRQNRDAGAEINPEQVQ